MGRPAPRQPFENEASRSTAIARYHIAKELNMGLLLAILILLLLLGGGAYVVTSNLVLVVVVVLLVMAFGGYFGRGRLR